MLLRHLVKTIGLTTLFFLTNSIYSQECSPDLEAPTITCKDEFVTYVLEGFESEAEVIAEKVVSFIADNCSANEDLYVGISTDLDIESPPATTSILLGEGNWPVVIWAVDEANNTSSCFATVKVELLEVVEIVVFEDNDGDCIQDPGDQTLSLFHLEYLIDISHVWAVVGAY